MPVYKIAEMPYDEFVKWQLYFERRPVGWRDDDRTMKLLQVQGVKAKPEAVFSSLAQLARAQQEIENSKKEGFIFANNLKGSFLFSKLLSAEGGDKLEF